MISVGEKVNRWVCDKYEGYRGGNSTFGIHNFPLVPNI